MFDVNSFAVVPNGEQKTNTESIYVMSNERYSNLGQMENFPASKETIGEGMLAVSYNFDYAQVPMNYDTKSIWEELSEPVTEAGGYVWDTAKGTWESVKETAVAASDKVLNAVDSAGNALVEVGESWFSMVKQYFIFAALFVLFLIWFIPKTGILAGAADILRAAK